jgi:hypothetical protein
VLRLSECAAYGRIEAARAGRQFPVVLTRLMAGEITLTGVGLLRPILTEENHVRLFDAARYKTKREIEDLVAAEHPRPDVPAAVRALASDATPVALVGPLAPDRYYMQFTIGRATYQKLRRARDLLLAPRRRPMRVRGCRRALQRDWRPAVPSRRAVRVGRPDDG